MTTPNGHKSADPRYKLAMQTQVSPTLAKRDTVGLRCTKRHISSGPFAGASSCQFNQLLLDSNIGTELEFFGDNEILNNCRCVCDVKTIVWFSSRCRVVARVS